MRAFLTEGFSIINSHTPIIAGFLYCVSRKMASKDTTRRGISQIIIVHKHIQEIAKKSKGNAQETEFLTSKNQ